MRPILVALREMPRAGIPLYVYHAAEPAFTYYKDRSRHPIRLAAEPILGVHGRDDWSAYPADLDRLRGRRRVWVVFSHVVKVSGVDEERFLLFFLDRLGWRREEKSAFGASAYRYDLSGASSDPVP